MTRSGDMIHKVSYRVRSVLPIMRRPYPGLPPSWGMTVSCSENGIFMWMQYESCLRREVMATGIVLAR